MQIYNSWSWEAPNTISGGAVVVDVYAATTNIASFLTHRARKLFLVNNQTVHSLKKRYPHAVVIGESLELPRNFFHASNRPSEATTIDVRGKVVIFMSNNGTRVLQEIIRKGANPVMTASFTNIEVVAHWLLHRNLKNLTIVAAGEMAFSDHKVVEDQLCAELLRDLILKKTVDTERQMKKVRDFILSTYELSGELDPNLHIPLSLNKYPVVPLCGEHSPGIIEVVDAL